MLVTENYGLKSTEEYLFDNILMFNVSFIYPTIADSIPGQSTNKIMGQPAIKIHRAW